MTKKKRRTHWFFGLLFRILLIVAAAAMVLSYVALFVNPSKCALPLLFGLFFIPILFLNVLLMVVALANRSKSVWIPIIVALPSLLYAELFYKFSAGDTPDKEGIVMRVESLNVGMFSSSSLYKTRDACRKALVESLQRTSPDVVSLQEFFVESYQMADTLLGRLYPYRHYHLFKVHNGKLFGNIILSKLPIMESGTIRFRRSTNLSVWADIDHYGRRIRVYNNHLESYNISFTSLVKRFAEEESAEQIGMQLEEVGQKMIGTVIRRSDQANAILENINGCSFPAIICGDFNDTPMSYVYHTLAKGRKDSFKDCGKGFGSTFAPLWPLLRIDYIIYPEEYCGMSHKVLKENISDHYPVVAEIII